MLRRGFAGDATFGDADATGGRGAQLGPRILFEDIAQVRNAPFERADLELDLADALPGEIPEPSDPAERPHVPIPAAPALGGDVEHAGRGHRRQHRDEVVVGERRAALAIRN